jgi:hypothetical protein
MSDVNSYLVADLEKKIEPLVQLPKIDIMNFVVHKNLVQFEFDTKLITPFSVANKNYLLFLQNLADGSRELLV